MVYGDEPSASEMSLRGSFSPKCLPGVFNFVLETWKGSQLGGMSHSYKCMMRLSMCDKDAHTHTHARTHTHTRTHTQMSVCASPLLDLVIVCLDSLSTSVVITGVTAQITSVI